MNCIDCEYSPSICTPADCEIVSLKAEVERLSGLVDERDAIMDALTKTTERQAEIASILGDRAKKAESELADLRAWKSRALALYPDIDDGRMIAIEE